MKKIGNNKNIIRIGSLYILGALIIIVAFNIVACSNDSNINSNIEAENDKEHRYVTILK